MDIKELDREIKALNKRIATEGNTPMSTEDIKLLFRAEILKVKTILQRLIK